MFVAGGISVIPIFGPHILFGPQIFSQTPSDARSAEDGMSNSTNTGLPLPFGTHAAGFGGLETLVTPSSLLSTTRPEPVILLYSTSLIHLPTLVVLFAARRERPKSPFAPFAGLLSEKSSVRSMQISLVIGSGHHRRNRSSSSKRRVMNRLQGMPQSVNRHPTGFPVGAHKRGGHRLNRHNFQGNTASYLQAI